MGRSSIALLAVSTSLALAAPAMAADGPPPPPKAVNGHAVTAVATGVPVPTAFAFVGDHVFAGSGPAENGPGGLFALANGTATKIPGTPQVVFGLAQRKGTLYVSSGEKLIAYKGFDGTRFASSKTLYTISRGANQLLGLAVGPDGRIYAGVSFKDKYEFGGDPMLAQAVVSFRADGKDRRIVARGMRQPFQMVFPKGSPYPYVSVLAQDSGKIPADHIVVAKPGSDFGFPTCSWLAGQACDGFDEPLIDLPKHASPMGIGAIGQTLYVALFNGRTKSGPSVITVPASGGKVKPFLFGFVAPIVGLKVHQGFVYVGDLTGTVYRVKA